MKPHKVRPGYNLFPVKFGKFDEIPNEWDEKPLDFFLEINMGQSPPSTSYNDQEDGPAFLQGVSEFGETYPETKVWCSDPKKVCDSNEILFSVRAPVGKINLSKTRTCIGRGLAALKPKKNYDLKYCYYILQFFSNRFIPYSEGTTYDAINQDDIKKVIVPFTENILEEEKIGSILSNIDELIKKQQQVITQTQKLMRGQMQKLLTKGIDHTKFTNRPWLFGKNIEIPEEWELKRIKDITEVSVGLVINPSTYFDDSGTVPMITGKNVTENGIVLDNVDFISEKSNELLDKTRIWSGDLVTMRVGYPGRTSLVKDEHDGINCASVIITRKNKKFNSQFLCYLANSELISNQVTKYEAGSAQKVINIDSWEKFLIPFPPLPEQQKIASILSNLDSLIQEEKQYKEKLEKIKRGLMQQLLTGKTRVKV